MDRLNDDEAADLRDRAYAAEDELTALRRDLAGFITRLRRAELGGPVVYREVVADQLDRLMRP